MPMPHACLAIAIPPPEAEAALASALHNLFPTLEPSMLAPFFETGETLYLSSTDRPVLSYVAHNLKVNGQRIEACDPPADLQTERSLVMPHPEAGVDRRTVIMLGRRRPVQETRVAVTIPFHDPGTLETTGRPTPSPCPSCREPLLHGIAFCPTCGHEPPTAPAIRHQLDIRLPDDQRRHRLLGWLAQATGLPIPKLRPGTGHHVQVQLTVSPEVVDGLTRTLAGWGAVVTVDTEADPPLGWDLKDSAIRLSVAMIAAVSLLPHSLGTGGIAAIGVGAWVATHPAAWRSWRHWRTGGVPTIEADAAARMAGPLPADLLADMRACLAETATSGLKPAVQRTLSATVGIFGAIGASDNVRQHLWQDLEPQIRAVVSGILGLVRRGRQLETYLRDHSDAAVDHEIRRLERLLERTSDPVSRTHYEQALTSARQTRQRCQDARVAAERLASQLLVLLHGLADVQATVAMSGLGTSGHDGAGSPLIAQLRQLQQDVRSTDEALQELLP